MCPWVLRALFNYLGLEDQAARGDIPPPRRYRAGRTSDVIEYVDWDRNRIALAQKEHHTNRAWDPKSDALAFLAGVPPFHLRSAEVEFDVVLIPGGEVLTVKLARSSGVAVYDSAVERAILKASPLPLPPDPAAFPEFRELHLKIRPKE